MSEENDDNIVARCHCGSGAIVFIAANDPRVMDQDMFKEIGNLIRAGCSIEHMTTANFRKSKFGCKRCK